MVDDLGEAGVADVVGVALVARLLVAPQRAARPARAKAVGGNGARRAVGAACSIVRRRRRGEGAGMCAGGGLIVWGGARVQEGLCA